jgi:hypothetical protein
MQRLYHILILFLALLPGVSAQSLYFETREIDLGEVRNWGLQPAVFYFENRGDAPVFILRSPPGSDFRIVYPSGYIQPGRRDSIVVYCIPKEKGSFVTNLDIYGSDSGKPYRLIIRAKVLSLDDCPGNEANVPDPTRLIRVVERGSNKPLPGAELNITGDRRNRISARSDRRGQYSCSLRPGLYSIDITLEGYIPYSEEFYLNRSTLILTYELVPLAEPLADVLPEPITAAIDSTPDVVPLPHSSDSLDPNLLSGDLYKPNNIVFLVDVSSSMRSADKLPLLKASIKRLVSVLRSYDHISLITYANEPLVLAEAWSGADKNRLLSLIDSLQAKGNTRGLRGMNKAYEIARRHYIDGANNIVIIATDGDFNGEEYSNASLFSLIRKQAVDGITCSVIGFGKGEGFELRMREMALAGKGSYIQMVNESQVVEEIMRRSLK